MEDEEKVAVVDSEYGIVSLLWNGIKLLLKILTDLSFQVGYHLFPRLSTVVCAS
jgi:hypothetical protein